MGFAETFKALSNPIRRDILDLLKLGQLSAGEISSHFELAGATISHHLSVLKKQIWYEKHERRILFTMNSIPRFWRI